MTRHIIKNISLFLFVSHELVTSLTAESYLYSVSICFPAPLQSVSFWIKIREKLKRPTTCHYLPCSDWSFHNVYRLITFLHTFNQVIYIWFLSWTYIVSISFDVLYYFSGCGWLQLIAISGRFWLKCLSLLECTIFPLLSLFIFGSRISWQSFRDVTIFF